MGDNPKQGGQTAIQQRETRRDTRGDKTLGRRTRMWGDNDRQLEAVGDIGNKGRQDGKAGIPSNRGTQEGRPCETSETQRTHMYGGQWETVSHTIQTQAHKKGDYGRQAKATRPERRTPPLRETHDGRQMKGYKAQTRAARRTPPLRETHEGRQIKGDKAQTRPERRTPPLKGTREGRQMKGDKAQTRPERRTPPLRETHEGRQGTDKTGEADTATQGNT